MTTCTFAPSDRVWHDVLGTGRILSTFEDSAFVLWDAHDEYTLVTTDALSPISASMPGRAGSAGSTSRPRRGFAVGLAIVASAVVIVALTITALALVMQAAS